MFLELFAIKCNMQATFPCWAFLDVSASTHLYIYGGKLRKQFVESTKTTSAFLRGCNCRREFAGLLRWRCHNMLVFISPLFQRAIQVTGLGSHLGGARLIYFLHRPHSKRISSSES